MVDLAGNVNECDPVCDLESVTLPDRRATRGGAFAFDAVFMASAARGRELESESSGLVGFRCARGRALLAQVFRTSVQCDP